MSVKQAQAGGETSNVNGQWYEGGQFMPWKVDGDGQKRKWAKGKSPEFKKQLVDYGTWELPPFSGARSLFEYLSRYISTRTGEVVINEAYVEYGRQFSETHFEEVILPLIELFKSGEKWFYDQLKEW